MNEAPSYRESWVSEVSANAERFGLVFAQLGAAQRPVRSFICEHVANCTTVAEYLDATPQQAPSLVLIRDLEVVQNGKGPTLSAMRERVLSDMDRGVKFILLSTMPRTAYGPVPGSSLLEDAKFSYGPVLALSSGVADPSLVLPDRTANNTDLSMLLSEILQELGVEVCASLDHAMFEAMLNPNDVFSTLTSREIEALQGASLVVVLKQKAEWSVPKRLGELKEALSDVLAKYTAAQVGVAEIFDAIWVLERTIRQSVRSQAKREWNTKWRQEVLQGDLPAKVLERAALAAYAAAKTIKEIRDPLEWLSLGELLQIRSDRTGIGELGVESPLWKLFAAEILPIRNRLSHMRLMRPEDLAIALKWLKVMERKLVS